MTLQHITLAEVKAKCRELYAQNRLLAQSGLACGYGYQKTINDIDYRCAIGVVLSPETLALIETNCSQCTVLEDLDPDDDDPETTPFVTFDPAEAKELFEIQTAHDDWLTSVRANSPSAEIYRKDFLELIE